MKKTKVRERGGGERKKSKEIEGTIGERQIAREGSEGFKSMVSESDRSDEHRGSGESVMTLPDFLFGGRKIQSFPK